MKIVQRALQEIDEVRRVKGPAEMIKPIARKVWGRKGHRFKSDKSRLETFCNAISFVLTTCSAASEMEIPPLEKIRRDEAVTHLSEAMIALGTLRRRVKGGT